MLTLAEIKGEKSFDILAELIEPVTNIATDEKTAKLFGVRAVPEGMTVKDFILQRVKEAIPALMRNHKRDLIKILSQLSEMSEKEYKAQMTLDGVLLDLSQLISDPIFNAFFTMPQSIDKYSGSASENIKE